MHEMHCNMIKTLPTLKKVFDDIPGIVITDGSAILEMSPNTKEIFGLDENMKSLGQLKTKKNIHVKPIDIALCIFTVSHADPPR
jgi:hypothetical protein